MKFPICADLKDFSKSLSGFISITGYKSWENRLSILNSQCKKNPLLEGYLLRRYPIELAMSNLLKYKNTRKRLPNKIMNINQYELYSFIIMVDNVYERLSDKGRKILKGRLLDSLGSNSDAGLLPIQHEMNVAGHLMNRGFEVCFQDIERGGGFDFLAELDKTSLEVECKCITDNLGRKVHSRAMIELCNKLLPVLRKHSQWINGGYYVNISMHARLETDHNKINIIIDAFEKAIRIQTDDVLSHDFFDVYTKKFDLENSPFARNENPYQYMDELLDFCHKRFSKENEETFIDYVPGKKAVVVVVDSKQQRSIGKRIYDTLKDACSSQLTKNWPGIIAVGLSGLKSQELRSLVEYDKSTGGRSGLNLIADRLMRSDERKHIHSVVYMSRASHIDEREYMKEGGVMAWSVPGVTYRFINDKNSHADDKAYDVFGIKSEETLGGNNGP